MLLFFDSISAIAWAASSFFIYIWVLPNFFTDSFISLAASASASDLIIWAFFNSSSRSTINFCLSAICCWTALLSTALEYYRLNPRCIKLTSSTLILKSLAFVYNWDRIYLLIVSLFFNNWSASSEYWIVYIEQQLFSKFIVRLNWRSFYRILDLEADGLLAMLRLLAVGGFLSWCWLFAGLLYQLRRKYQWVLIECHRW